MSCDLEKKIHTDKFHPEVKRDCDGGGRRGVRVTEGCHGVVEVGPISASGKGRLSRRRTGLRGEREGLSAIVQFQRPTAPTRPRRGEADGRRCLRDAPTAKN